MSGIDHLVLCAHDLEAARMRYGAMGFTLTPRAQHPFGTANSLVQLQGCFLELLTVAAPADIGPHGPDTFSFGAFNRDFLQTGEGFSMLVLQSEDSEADQRKFIEAGLKTYQPFGFSRTATLPDGENVTVSFSLAFATDPQAPMAGYFTCQQHAPEHFWKPDYQRHDNTAQTITEVCLVSAEPERHRQFLEGFTQSEAVSNGGGHRLATPRGSIAVTTPDMFEATYGTVAPELTGGARFAGYRIGVSDLSAVEQLLHRNDVPYSRAGGRIVIAPSDAFGVAIAFEQLSQ